MQREGWGILRARPYIVALTRESERAIKDQREAPGAWLLHIETALI